MHKLQVTTLEQVAFTVDGDECLNDFVVAQDDKEGKKSNWDVQKHDLVDGDVVIDYCLDPHEAGDVCNQHSDVHLRLEHGKCKVQRDYEKVGEIDMLRVVCERQKVPMKLDEEHKGEEHSCQHGPLEGEKQEDDLDDMTG